MFYSSFYFVPFFLQALLSILAIIFLAVKWKSSSAKALMISVVVVGFLIPSILAIGATLAYFIVASSGFNVGYQFYQTFSAFLLVAIRLLPLISLALILFYIFQRKKIDDATSWLLDNAVASAKTVSDAEKPLRAAQELVPPLAWNTEIDPKQSIKILRRREWGFLIDVLPVIFFNVSCLLLLATTDSPGNYGRYGRSAMGPLIGSLPWITTIALLVYLPFKDAIKGVSFGKMFSKCRVVRTKDGAPIGPGESLARNALFLFPLMAIVELAVASLRPDRKRLGDLLAGTTVVTGEADFVNGLENESKQPEAEEKEKPVPHPLDD